MRKRKRTIRVDLSDLTKIIVNACFAWRRGDGTASHAIAVWMRDSERKKVIDDFIAGKFKRDGRGHPRTGMTPKGERTQWKQNEFLPFFINQAKKEGIRNYVTEGAWRAAKELLPPDAVQTDIEREVAKLLGDRRRGRKKKAGRSPPG